MRMDRILATVLGVILTFSCTAQISTLRKLDLLTRPKEYSKYDTTGYSSLPEPDSYCIKSACVLGGRPMKAVVIDLNQDSLKDIILSGDCCPYAATEIFINRGDSMELVYERTGDLVNILQSDSVTNIAILARACCCEETNELITLSINGFGQIKSSSIVYYYDTKLKMEIGIKREVASGMIRRTPVEDNTKRKSDCWNEIVEGNGILSIDKPSNVYVLHEANGWKLVLYEPTYEYALIGWIKAGN